MELLRIPLIRYVTMDSTETMLVRMPLPMEKVIVIKFAISQCPGVYFAVQASNSSQNTYAPPDRHGVQFMFLARVLVGEYTQGTSSLLAPPSRPHPYSDRLYDSVVDNVNSPSMYIIFRDDQAYPEYLIQFTTKSK
jgi:hypothetical protein